MAKRTKMPPTKKPPKRDPKWRMVEQVVALLERTLDRNATVQHDVRLRDLKSQRRRRRQCDVVVTTGPEHRRTRTIVEVQKRGRKVELAQFEAWVAKMGAVGAQHLICVSAKGYPSSVVELAAQLGPTVRLVTLEELEQDSPILLGALGPVQMMGRTLQVMGFSELELVKNEPPPPGDGASPSGTLDWGAPIFRSAAGETFSVRELASKLAHRNGENDKLPVGNYRVRILSTDTFDCIAVPALGRVQVSLAIDVIIHDDVAQCQVLGYKQEGDTLAWAVVGEIPRANGEPVVTTWTFRPGPDGRLAPQLMKLHGVRDGDVFWATVNGQWTTGTLTFKRE